MDVPNERVLTHRVLELRGFATLDALLGVRGRNFTHDGEHLRGRQWRARERLALRAAQEESLLILHESDRVAALGNQHGQSRSSYAI